jgi:hypothetical protein
MHFHKFSFSQLSATLFAVGFLLSAPAHATDIFTLTVTTGGGTGSLGFTSVPDLFDKLSNGGLKSVESSYTNTAAANASIDYRGLPIQILTTANSDAVQLNIKSLGISENFSKQSTRDGNLDDLTNYFKRDGGAIIAALQKKLAEVSPVDPIAGNPASLQSQMASSDFDQTFTSFATQIKAAPNANGQQQGANSGLLALGLRFGNYSQAGLTTKTVTLPLSYTFHGWGDGRQLTINMPLTYGKTEGAQIVQGGLGVAYRHPINDNWALTPALNVAASGSVDLGSVGAMTSASLTSQYGFKFKDLDWSMGNMIGTYSTLKIKTKDYSYDPGITNTIFRNGLMVSQPVSLVGHKLAIEYSFVNTRFNGAALYNQWTNEFSLTIGTSKASNLPSYLRAGITILRGQKSQGTTFNVGYWF